MAVSISFIVRAFERAWRSIARHHRELPVDVLIVVAGAGRRKAHGHFAGSRWVPAEESEEARHEIWIAGERLADPTLAFETLLHEAAHALNYTRKIKDTDQTGRVHNKKYRDAAVEVGLDVAERHPMYGYFQTFLKDDTVARYKNDIDYLKEALKTYRLGEAPAPPTQRLLRAACPCKRIIRASRTVFDEGAPLCPLCGGEFSPSEGE